MTAAVKTAAVSTAVSEGSVMPPRQLMVNCIASTMAIASSAARNAVARRRLEACVAVRPPSLSARFTSVLEA